MEASHGTPYIMPDGSGRPLSQYLKDNSLESGPPQRSKSRGKARRWEAREAAHSGNGADPDVALLYKVGREKRRRWLADTLLRRMAGGNNPVTIGTLSAEQMEGLFSPVPFGEVRTTVMERIAAPELAPVWDMFRSIDPDKQDKVLLVQNGSTGSVEQQGKGLDAAQKWEAHLREEKGMQGEGGPGAAQAAWARWAGVSRKARLVLKRASPELVAVLELSFLHFLDQEQDEELEVALEDGFQRLIAHGLAAFHGLLSSSREAASGKGRSVIVRKPRPAVKEQGVAASRTASQITCADILFALQDQPAGLTPALLARFVSQKGHESSSEASYVLV